MSRHTDEAEARAEILRLTKEYCCRHHAKPPYSPGDFIPYAGRVYDENDMANLVDSALDFWLTAGRYADRFEKELAERLGVGRCALVNSGSSANLLAFMALTSPKLGERAIRPAMKSSLWLPVFPRRLRRFSNTERSLSSSMSRYRNTISTPSKDGK